MARRTLAKALHVLLLMPLLVAHDKAVTENYVIEAALAHKVGNDVIRSNLRSDLFAKRRALTDAWAQYCSGDEATGNYRARWLVVHDHYFG